jgi:tRNA(Leu) C34 or U34 (ribose-2'-O)-methylase TrmL
MNGVKNRISFALFEPDIPQNAGNVFRTAACLNTVVHVIEPCGFALSHAKLRRAGMDYIDHLESDHPHQLGKVRGKQSLTIVWSC